MSVLYGLPMYHLMEQVCHRDNLNLAYKRVKSNKGAAGVDQMSVAELGSWIRLNKEALIGSLLDGSYQPQLVRGVKIPKPGGKGKRQLAQLSQLGIEIDIFDIARAVGFHHKAYLFN